MNFLNVILNSEKVKLITRLNSVLDRLSSEEKRKSVPLTFVEVIISTFVYLFHMN